MNKYNEIMNHIEMDDERRNRILEGINLQLENEITETTEKSEKKSSGISVKWIVAASIAASVLIIAIPLNFFRFDPDNPDGPTIEVPEETTVISSELSSAVSGTEETGPVQSSASPYKTEISSGTKITSETETGAETEAVTYTKASSEAAAESSAPVTIPTKIITQGSTEGQITAAPTEIPAETTPQLTEPASYNPVTTKENPDATVPPSLFTVPPAATDPPGPDESPVPSEYTEYDTLDELNNATGYSTSHLPWLPFKVNSIYYASYDNTAEITYSNDTDSSVKFEQSYDKLITDPDIYESTETINISGTSVTLYIEDSYSCTAEFHDGKYWYCISLATDDDSKLNPVKNIKKIISVYLEQ